MESAPAKSRRARRAKGKRAPEAAAEERESSKAKPQPEKAAEPGMKAKAAAPGERKREAAAREAATEAAKGEKAEKTAPEVPRPQTYRVRIQGNRVDEDAVKVLRRLTRHGHVAYLVGGGVRDLLLKEEPKDFDVGTSARPGQVKRLFRNCRLIGRRFRLAHILFAGGKIIEVATFRRGDFAAAEGGGEEKSAGAEFKGAPSGEIQGDTNGDEERDILIRRDNVFGEPHEDAYRRDFTINGLFYDIEKRRVIDYVGGVHDLRRRVVRTIGRPDVRFREDPVRILRAIRFSARLDMGIEPEVYDAMVDQRWELERSAPPRVLEEVLKLLRCGAAHRAIYLAWDVGVLGVLFPGLEAFLEDEGAGADLLWGRLSAVDRRARGGRLPADAVLLTALFNDVMHEAADGEADVAEALKEFFEEVTGRFGLPRRVKDRMRRIFAVQGKLGQGKVKALRARDYFEDAVTLLEIGCEAEGAARPAWLSEGAGGAGGDGGRKPKKGRPRRRRAKGGTRTRAGDGGAPD
jgi:poly(A) polymerase